MCQPGPVRPQATLPLSLGLVWAGVGPARSAYQRLAPLRGSWRPSQRAPTPLLGQDQALCHVRGTVGQVATCSPLLDILKALSPSLRQSPVSPVQAGGLRKRGELSGGCAGLGTVVSERRLPGARLTGDVGPACCGPAGRSPCPTTGCPSQVLAGPPRASPTLWVEYMHLLGSV